MELVYLWVEDYKNIKKQGFNFSPRFECKYDENTKKLTINENKEYVSIFPEKINITAIVGENGSGKSSVLDFISLILLTNEKKYNYFLICSEGENNLVIHENFDKEIKDINNKIKECNKTSTNNILDNYKNLSSLHIDKHEKNYAPIDNTDNALNIISNTKKYPVLKFINDSTKFFLPTIARINIKTKGITPEEQKEVDTLNENIQSSLEEKKYNECLNNIQSILSTFENTKYKPSTGGSVIFNIINNSKIYNNFTYDAKIKDIDREYLDFIKKLSKLDVDIELLDNTKSFKDLSFGEQYLLKQLHTILNSFDTNKVNVITHSYWNDKVDEREDFDEKIKIEKYFLFIDEFELGLHPNWQKKTLSYMIDFFTLFDIKIDLFITSHSPFILSDLPKENVIFLDKFDEKTKEKYPKLKIDGLEKGNCINASEHIKFKTFGANIHTLLSNGFFMKDGLMGEFAKSKINKIMRFLSGKNKFIDFPIKDIKKVIELIGEPFLKEKLLFMYNEKYPKTNEEKIVELEAEITRLKNGQNQI